MAETATATDDQKARAAVAYILLWITGLIIFFTAKKEDRYARWHAVQAIALGIVVTIVNWVISLFSAVLTLGAGPNAWMFGAPLFGLGSLLWLLTIILVVILAVKAYQGQTVRLPVLADFADKYA